MRLFDDNPQSKAMQSLIHDTRNCGDAIRYHLSKLGDRLKENGVSDPKAFIHMEYLRSKTKEIEQAIDAYYLRFSNDFPETEQAPLKPDIITAYNLADMFMPGLKWDSEKMKAYESFKWIIDNYTLIRKQTECVASKVEQGTNADNQKNNHE